MVPLPGHIHSKVGVGGKGHVPVGYTSFLLFFIPDSVCPFFPFPHRYFPSLPIPYLVLLLFLSSSTYSTYLSIYFINLSLTPLTLQLTNYSTTPSSHTTLPPLFLHFPLQRYGLRRGREGKGQCGYKNVGIKHLILRGER